MPVVDVWRNLAPPILGPLDFDFRAGTTWPRDVKLNVDSTAVEHHASRLTSDVY